MAHSFNTNLSNIAAKYTQQLNIPVTATSIKESIEQNPFYPSLYSLSNTFSKYKIETIAFEATAEQLTEVQTPFVAYMQTPNTGKDFVLITKKDSNSVTYIAQGNKEVTITQKEFLGRWQKIILVAEASSVSGEMDYDKKLAQEKSTKQKRTLQYIGATAILLLLIISSFATASTNYVYNSILLFTKLAGVAITTLLLIYEIDKSNTFVKNICTAGKQTNCDAVLNSGAGKFLGMSWSEVGFFYFASTFLVAVMPGLSFAEKLPWLSLAAIAVSPYILFSIYYQYKVVKQWCPLCLATQIVLAAELCWALYPVINNGFNTTASSIFQSTTFHSPLGRIGGAVLIPIVLWYFLKPLLLNAKETTQYKAAYKRLLYHPDTFNTSLQQQPSIADGWQNLGIDIGNPNASKTIVKVCNPYCGPCAKAHPVLEEIININGDINMKIIFSTTSKQKDKDRKPIQHFLALAEQENENKIKHALDEWYLAEIKDYDLFAMKYPVNEEALQQEHKIIEMKEWCDEAQIEFTPTIFINGKQLPEAYSVEELKFIL